MAWRELGQVFADGDTIVADDLLDTFIPMLTEFNGNLDRDNIGYEQVTDAKVVVNAVNRVWSGADDGPDTFAAEDARYMPMQEILAVDIDAEEWISVKASFSLRRGASAFSQACRVAGYILVDDVIVAMTQPMRVEGVGFGSSRSLGVACPVPSGAQTVRLMISAESLTRGNIGIELIVNSRSMTIVEGRR
jgi:hypothetical protein